MSMNDIITLQNINVPACISTGYVVNTHWRRIDMASISGIYQIKNRVTGKTYIGSAVDIKKRWSQHTSELNNNKHGNGHLQNSWNKYGSDAFEFSVLETCFIFALIFREQHYIDTIKPEYNISPKAGSNLGIKRTEEFRAKISAAMKGDKRNAGKIHSAETRANMAASQKGRKASPETRAKLSASAKNRTPEHRANLSAAGKGRIHTPEQRAKNSAWIRTPETRAKMSASHIGQVSNNKGKKASAETRAKMSASAIGKVLSPETREKISKGTSAAIKLWWAKRKAKKDGG